MKTLFVIGYGSTLRGDDGVGQRVVELVEARHWPGVESLARHQLTPELAEPISQAGAVVFVDATLEDTGGTVIMEPIQAVPAHQVMLHTASPASLLHLAQSLFGRCPPAWMVSVPVRDMGIGERLSPLAEQGAAEAVARIAKLIGELTRGSGRS